MNKIRINIKKGRRVDSKRRDIRICVHLEHEQTSKELPSSWISELKSEIEKAGQTLDED